jgi:hypothetical protein
VYWPSASTVHPSTVSVSGAGEGEALGEAERAANRDDGCEDGARAVGLAVGRCVDGGGAARVFGWLAGNATSRSGTAASSTGRTPHQHTAIPAAVAKAHTAAVRMAFQPVPMVAILSRE